MAYRCLLGVLFCVLTSFQLKEKDVRVSMEQMLNYHVEYKSFDAVLARRTLKILIEQSDPEKLYLLASEVQPYLNPTDTKLDLLVRQFRDDNLSEWKVLSQLFQNAVTRAQRCRATLEKELEGKESPPAENYPHYAANERELKERIQTRLARILAAEKKSPNETLSPEQREKIFAFWEGRYARFEKTYLPQESSLVMHILKAMARSLDAHTAYFTPEEALSMRTMLEKQFEGVGVVLRDTVDGVVIQEMIKGGPAEKSGRLKSGDVVVEVNGQSVRGAPYEDVLKKMQGRGSIELGVMRDGSLHKVHLVREKILMEEERVRATFEPFADGIIGKINLPSFYENGSGLSCEKDLREALRTLKKEGNLLGLVIDMRENSGGFLSQAVKVAGLFISSGVVVISKYAHGEVQYLRDLDGRSYYSGPLVILTSKASASAAEIVAQALQDYGTALVIGDERTYGKGTIQYQTVTDPSAASFFKVTVGRYYTVSGRTTQIDGVIADVTVPTVYAPYPIGERYLEFPLKSDRIPSAYVDPLVDVDPRNYPWFQQNYLPNLQKKLSVWTQMLPQLKENCGYRLQHNRDYELFLKASSLAKEGKRFTPTSQANFGVDDLQMAQAVEVVKDMALLQTEKRK